MTKPKLTLLDLIVLLLIIGCVLGIRACVKAPQPVSVKVKIEKVKTPEDWGKIYQGLTEGR